MSIGVGGFGDRAIAIVAIRLVVLSSKSVLRRGDITHRVVGITEFVALSIGRGIRIVRLPLCVVGGGTLVAVAIGDGGQVVVGIEAEGVGVLQGILRRGHIVVGGIKRCGEVVPQRIFDRCDFEATIVIIARGMACGISDDGDTALVGERRRIAQRVGDRGDAMTAIIGNGGGIVAGVGDGRHIRPRIGIARRFAQQVGGTGQIVVFVAIAGAAPRRVGEARDEVGAMPNRDDTTLGIGDGGGESAALAHRDAVAILVGDGGQAAVGAKEPLLAATVIGQRVGVVVVVHQRRVDAGRTGKAAIAVVGEIGVVVAAAIQDDISCHMAGVQIHLPPYAQVPVGAHFMIGVAVGLAIVVGVEGEVFAGAVYLHLDTLQDEVASGDIDQQFFLATGAGVQGMLDVGVEGQHPQPRIIRVRGCSDMGQHEIGRQRRASRRRWVIERRRGERCAPRSGRRQRASSGASHTAPPTEGKATQQEGDQENTNETEEGKGQPNVGPTSKQEACQRRRERARGMEMHLKTPFLIRHRRNKRTATRDINKQQNETGTPTERVLFVVESSFLNDNRHDRQNKHTQKRAGKLSPIFMIFR